MPDREFVPSEEKYVPTEQEQKIFKEVAQEMYEEAVRNTPDLEGFVTCGIDVESPEGLLQLAQAIRMKPE